MNDSLLFQSAMAHMLITIWLQLRVTIAKTEVKNTTISTNMNIFVEIRFTLDFVDGNSNGWTVVMTVIPKMEFISIKVCMTRVYMYSILTIVSECLSQQNYTL